MKAGNNQLRMKRLHLEVANPMPENLMPSNELYPNTGESGQTYNLEMMSRYKPKHELAPITCLHSSKRVVYFKDDDLGQPVFSCNTCGLILTEDSMLERTTR